MFKTFENGSLSLGTDGMIVPLCYLEGGYHTHPNGCTVWGTSEEKTNRFFGDEMGSILLTYADGSESTIPLVFGYTLWYRNIWREACAPFRSQEPEESMVAALRNSLCLLGAYEGEDVCYLAIRPENRPLVSIRILASDRKEGEPQFSGVYVPDALEDCPEALVKGMQRGFFEEHTVEAENPYPTAIRDSLDRINHRLSTFEEDFFNSSLEPYEPLSSMTVRFTGTTDAEIATRVFATNYRELCERVDEEGFVHTSGKTAPSWWYDGFGPWVENLGNYYGDYYARDAARALITLSALGCYEEAQRGVAYGNKLMMFFPENHMTFHGHPIPGHCPVVMNRPLFYSEILSISGWPTQYTEERFGVDYQKLGNQETDGHGLMMMANHRIWRHASDPQAWLSANWREIREGAEWILWCFEYPEISLARDGLLYAESEAGMNAYTLYCNVPCCLGLYGYAEMAEAMGETQSAEQWKCRAASMEKAITEMLADHEVWRLDAFGFFHDPVMTFCSDVFGYDAERYPEAWCTFSRNAYENDIGRSRHLSYDASGGVGYNTAMKTQSALLLDRYEDRDRLLIEMTRICYAPRLPYPYIVPEGLSYSPRIGALRRQGDLGNLVQMAEVMKTYQMAIGLFLCDDGTLDLIPRLPKGWGVEVRNYPVGGNAVQADLLISPDHRMVELTISDRFSVKDIHARLGGLQENTVLRINGTEVSSEGDFPIGCF